MCIPGLFGETPKPILPPEPPDPPEAVADEVVDPLVDQRRDVAAVGLRDLRFDRPAPVNQVGTAPQQGFFRRTV